MILRHQLAVLQRRQPRRPNLDWADRAAQAYVPAAIEHASRRIRILGITLHPTGEWTAQQARNLLLDLGELAHRVEFMIRERGSDFTAHSTRFSPMPGSGREDRPASEA